MAKKDKVESGEVYQVKISLRGSQPPIWRQLLIPAAATLHDLHWIIQASFGWTDSHPHQFNLNASGKSSRNTSIYQAEGVQYFSLPEFGLEETEDETAVTLEHVAPAARRKKGLSYWYDFGDDWMHDVLVEKTVPLDPDTKYPACIAGMQAAPIDDCGGIYGWYEMLEALADPQHEQYEDFREWVGDLKIDPDHFDMDKVNKSLRKIFKRKRP